MTLIKQLSPCLLVLAGVFLFSSTSHAARIPIKSGEVDVMTPLLPFKITEEQVKDFDLPKEWAQEGYFLSAHSINHWAIVPTKTQIIGYAINKPGDNQYWSLEEKSIIGLQAIGVLPEEIPDTKVPLFDTAKGIWIIIIGVLAVIFFVTYFLKKIEAKTRKELIEKVNGETEGKFSLVLREVLVTVANSDNDFDQQEADIINKILTDLGELKTVDINTKAQLSLRQLKGFLEIVTHNLTDDQRIYVLQCIAAVVLADGDIDRKEKKLFKDYILALGYSEKQSKDILKQCLATQE